jgi:antirestriction protein ArdC
MQCTNARQNAVYGYVLHAQLQLTTKGDVMPNVYDIVTEKIIAQLQQGVAPWRKPWRSLPPCNLISGKEYRGINPFLLVPQGYGSRYWLTFNQANKLGGRIRKGQHSSIVTFWNIGEEKLITASDGRTRKSKPFLLRYYNVFNLEQTENIADKLGIGNQSARVADIPACDGLLANMPNRPAFEQSHAAWYRPATDTIGMPAKILFPNVEEFYSTYFHELTHSTGHASRVGREGIEKIENFGSESYSREELVAEMGAAMLCGITGISPATIPNSAAYLSHWIQRLRGDSKLIIAAASQAQKAADYIRGIAKPSGDVADVSVADVSVAEIEA